MKSLPVVIDEWLKRGEQIIDTSVKPSWLLCDIREPVWQIYLPGETRKVREKWKGSNRLSWHLRIPGGRLTDPCWSRLLEHCKLLAIAHVECAAARAQTPRAVYPFCNELLILAEHLVVHYPDAAGEHGLCCLSPEKLNRYFGDYKHHGVAGVGNWLNRWDAYFRSLYRDNGERLEVEVWSRKQSDELRYELDDLDRRLITNDPPEIARMRVTLGLAELRFARHWLAMRGWYNTQGIIRVVKIAEAIEADWRRVSGVSHLQYHLRQFERCVDYRRQDFDKARFREKLSRRYRSPAQRFAAHYRGFSRISSRGLVGQLKRYAPFISDLSESPLATLDLENISADLFDHNDARTPTLPVDTAMYLYDRMIHWAIHYTIPLTDFYISILNSVLAKQPEIRLNNSRRHSARCSPQLWEAAFSEQFIPKELADLRLWQYRSIRVPSNLRLRLEDGGSAVPSILRNKGLTLMDAMDINTAVLVGLVAAFAIRRRDEIIKLHRNCISEDGRGAYIDFAMCKIQIDGIRAQTRRPIPTFLFRALQIQKRLAESISHAQPHGDSFLHERLFAVPGTMGGVVLDRNLLSDDAMNLFCDYVESPCDARGRRWYLKLHECRRFGAMTFFHQHGEHVSLPALAWWLGHDDLHSTWRYIREQLTGREVTALDVALTTQAIVGPVANEGAECLRDVVRRHFGAERIDLIDADEISAYLEMLLEEGLYRVAPHTIDTDHGKRYVILIHVSEEIKHA